MQGGLIRVKLRCFLYIRNAEQVLSLVNFALKSVAWVGILLPQEFAVWKVVLQAFHWRRTYVHAEVQSQPSVYRNSVDEGSTWHCSEFLMACFRRLYLSEHSGVDRRKVCLSRYGW